MIDPSTFKYKKGDTVTLLPFMYRSERAGIDPVCYVNGYTKPVPFISYADPGQFRPYDSVFGFLHMVPGVITDVCTDELKVISVLRGDSSYGTYGACPCEIPSKYRLIDRSNYDLPRSWRGNIGNSCLSSRFRERLYEFQTSHDKGQTFKWNPQEITEKIGKFVPSGLGKDYPIEKRFPWDGTLYMVNWDISNWETKYKITGWLLRMYTIPEMRERLFFEERGKTRRDHLIELLNMVRTTSGVSRWISNHQILETYKDDEQFLFYLYAPMKSSMELSKEVLKDKTIQDILSFYDGYIAKAPLDFTPPAKKEKDPYDFSDYFDLVDANDL